MEAKGDIWSVWLRKRRFGGDENYQKYALEQYRKLASKIVDKAEIFESATVLDVGTGDGIVGLTALSKLGVDGKLILSDISEDALVIPKEIFNHKEIRDSRIEFLVAGVENLSPLSENSVDRVVMRSVLLYAENKLTAFSEIFRILRHGGIAVIMEPINQRHTELRSGLFWGYRLDKEPLLSIKSLLQKVTDESNHQMNQTQSSLIGYNEHDLVKMAIRAGFEEIELEYSLIRTCKVYNSSWEFFIDTAPNPRAQTLRELMYSVLTPDEFDKAEKTLKQIIQQPTVRINSNALLILKR